MLKKYAPYFVAFSITLLLFVLLNRQLFTSTIHQKNSQTTIQLEEITIDKIENDLLQKMSESKKTYYTSLKKNLEQTNNLKEAYKKIQQFWKDSTTITLPYFYYLGKEGLLTKNEQKILFVANFFFETFQNIKKKQFKKWFAQQARDLFEAASTINPKNDSTKVFLGATLLFGGIAESPMQAVSIIKKTVDQDSTFIFGQKMMGKASFLSGQYDKAIYRLEKVKKQNPLDLENLLLLAESYEHLNKKNEAKQLYLTIKKYTKSLDFINQLNQKINSL